VSRYSEDGSRKKRAYNQKVVMHKRNDFSELFKRIFAPQYGYYKFLTKINPQGVFLDVGCGSSTSYIKTIAPKIKYIGIDVVEYNPVLFSMADTYIKTTSEKFIETLTQFNSGADIVFSLHNLEHCNDREGTLQAMASALKHHGMLFLTFPSEKSIGFPKRKGTLNYYDDAQHKDSPPVFDDVVKTLEEQGIKIEYKNRSYRPAFLYVVGLLLEPISALLKKSMFGQYGTWSFWGFEAVIWGVKK